MQDLELPDHEDSELMLTEAAESVSGPDTEADEESGEGEGDAGKVFRGAYTSKDPKEIIKRVREFEAHIQAAAKRFGVKPEHMRAIMAQESGANPNADANPRKRLASAAGLMQVTGETWTQMRNQHADLKPYDFASYKYDPRINCLFGAATLASKQGILTASGVDKNSAHFAQLTVAAYNGGEGVVKAALAHARAAGSKDPEADCLKEAHLVPAIGKYPSVYNYYLTGGGAGNNKSKTRDEAIRLKFREISKYPDGVTKFLGAQRDLGMLDGKSETKPETTDAKSETKPETTDTKSETTDTKSDTTEQKSDAKSAKPDRYEYAPDRYHGHKLSGSVGRGGDNRKADVIAVQNRLRFSAIDTGSIDGAIGPITLAAIGEFQRHFLRKPDGLIEVGKKTAKELFSGKTEVTSVLLDGKTSDATLESKEQVQPQTVQSQSSQKDDDNDRDKDKDDDQKADKSDVSSKGAAQMSRLVSTAAGVAGGKRPRGKCYAAVKRHIANAGGYGNIRNIYADARFQPQGEARNFAEVVNAKGPEKFGLERLSINSPYDAPEGSLVVVSAGSPGTHHKTAGDITVKGPGDRFFNDGEMKYRGREAWPPKSGRVLGVYRVK